MAVATTAPWSLVISRATTDRMRPSFFGGGGAVNFAAVCRAEVFDGAAGGDAAAPLGAGAAAAHRVRQGGQGPAVDVAVRIDAVRAYNKLPLGIARPHVGEDDAVFIGELVGGVDHGVEVDSRQVGVGRRERQGKHSFFTKSLKDGKTGRVVSIRPSGA